MEFGRVKLNIYRTLRDLLQDAVAQLRLLLLHLVNSRVEARVLLLQLLNLGVLGFTDKVNDLV